MNYTIVPRGTASGPGWQYRLEQNGVFSAWQDWTADLAFTTDPSGSELQTGVLYWLYARNAAITAYEPGSLESELAAALEILPSGSVISATPDGSVGGNEGSVNTSTGKSLLQLTWEAAVDTADHPSQLGAVKAGLAIRLSELINLEAAMNLLISGAGNNLIWRGNTGATGGYYAQWTDVFSNIVTKFFAGIRSDGLAGFSDDAGRVAGFLREDFIVQGIKKLLAGQAKALFQDVSLSRLLANTGSITGLFAPQTDVNTGESKLVLVSRDQVFAYILPSLTAYLDSIDYSNGMDGDSRPVLGIYCYDAAPPSGEALTYQDIDITPSMIGVMQSHNLQVSGNLIYPVLTDSEYRNAFDYMSIVFTGTTGFTITGASDFTGQLHLQKRNLAS
ncbi:hypothetical protein [Spirosoma pollinicola]|uniref:Uncharacterized protein n=1 Tax=Spirosoma pollinicola TaxID=2057025 RepID=A0A2K8YTG6_9BACT|nr:hypothetical protein [Spirosoma pollinicola]AUD00926.1 hypothetical protein CWM47_03310 [Spirosoma pollinicola]